VIKRIFAAVIISIAIFSCNDASDKTVNGNKHKAGETGDAKRNDQLIYLDTAENMYNLLCQGWVIADDADALKGMTEDSKFEIAHRSFYFAANGTFVKNPRNAIDYGQWEYDDEHKTITLHYAVEKGKDVYKIAALAPDELKLLNIGINTSTILEFISDGKRFKDPNQEPFDLQNNRWRIKPLKKEADTAIHQRLKENLRFFILFYKSVITRDEKEVSFWGLPSCFKWYGGGIYLKKEEELKDNWINCFYDKEQATQAYKLAEQLLEKKYTWPKGESNWLKQNLYVLEQMYKNMDEIH
jgi:hypothetical protein